MSDYSTRNIIDYAYDDEGKEMRDALYASIHDRVMAHIEAMKQGIAENLITQESVDDEDDLEFNEDDFEDDGEEVIYDDEDSEQVDESLTHTLMHGAALGAGALGGAGALALGTHMVRNAMDSARDAMIRNRRKKATEKRHGAMFAKAKDAAEKAGHKVDTKSMHVRGSETAIHPNHTVHFNSDKGPHKWNPRTGAITMHTESSVKEDVEQIDELTGIKKDMGKATSFYRGISKRIKQRAKAGQDTSAAVRHQQKASRNIAHMYEDAEQVDEAYMSNIKLSPKHKDHIIKSINTYSRGGHPMPTPDSVHHFGLKFAHKMVKKAHAAGHPVGDTLKHLENHLFGEEVE